MTLSSVSWYGTHARNSHALRFENVTALPRPKRKGQRTVVKMILESLQLARRLDFCGPVERGENTAGEATD